MARIRILRVSLNDLYYDTAEISKMSFDEALNFFNWEDEIHACNVDVIQVDDTKDNEMKIFPEGAEEGDAVDTLLTWCKVDCC